MNNHHGADVAASRTYLKPDGGKVTVRVETPVYNNAEDWWYCRWAIAGFEEDDEFGLTVPGPDSMAALITALAMCGDTLEASQQRVGYRLEYQDSTENQMLRTDTSGDFDGWAAAIRIPRSTNAEPSTSGGCYGAVPNQAPDLHCE